MSNIETIYTVDGAPAIEIRADRSDPMVTIATFDGDNRVSEWRAALEKDREIEFANGYAAARANYTLSRDDPDTSEVFNE